MPAKQRVLLAEDDWAQTDILREVLEFEGYAVSTASHSEQVVERLSERPDAVLLDVFGVSSPEVASALNALTPRPVVILLSADERAASLAPQMGADQFLSKPYDLDRLLQTLSSLLASRGPGPSSAGAA